MASTTQTTNFGLPIYQSSDRPAWTDTNTPFQALDTALKSASDNASSAADAVSTLTTSLASLNQTVSGHTTELSTLTSAVATAATAQGTSFTAHGLNTATDAQTAIQNAATASINSYDNTDSGLTAANVQDAIDEVISELTNMIKVVTPTVTTDSNGYAIINTYIPDGYYPIVALNTSVGASVWCEISYHATSSSVGYAVNVRDSSGVYEGSITLKLICLNQ